MIIKHDEFAPDNFTWWRLGQYLYISHGKDAGYWAYRSLYNPHGVKYGYGFPR